MKKVLIVSIAVFAALFFVGCATKAPKEVVVQFDGNPTTGYIWTCKIQDTSVVSMVSDEYVVNEHSQGMVGVGGHWSFVFEPVFDGETTIEFNYARSWEKEPLESVIYIARVQKGKLTVSEK